MIRFYQSRRVLLSVLAVPLMGLVASTSGQSPTQADFSIEAGSPTVGESGGFGGTITAADVLVAAGQLGPLPHPQIIHTKEDLQLYKSNDDLDGLSVNRANSGTLWYFCFSVDADAVGGAGPINPAGFVWPYNVRQQASLKQAAGDIFASTEIYDVGNGRRIGGLGEYNNVLFVNQATMFEQNLNLLPIAVPAKRSVLEVSDNLDAFTRFARGSFNDDQQGQLSGSDYFFSLTAASDSLDTLPGSNGSGADIFGWDAGSMGSELYVGYSQLGLAHGDDIDALVVADTPDDTNHNGTWENLDFVLFSLSPDSPTLASLGASPGDIFLRKYGNAGRLDLSDRIASATDLGLDVGDNVDGLDIGQSHCSVNDISCIARALSEGVMFGSQNLTVPGLQVGVPATLQVINAVEGQRMWFGLSTDLAPTYIAPFGITLALRSPVRILGNDIADASGIAEITVTPVFSNDRVYLQATSRRRVTQVVIRAVYP